MVVLASPSMYTRAIPDHSSRYATQLTPVPVKLSVTREFASVARIAPPPLWAGLLFEYHRPDRTMAGLFSSTRPLVAVTPPATGAPFSISNASIHTHEPC